MARTLNDYPAVALKIDGLDCEIDFVRLFGRIAPVQVEIGTGKAGFLLNQARLQPMTDFVGIEWANKYYRYSVDRIGRWGLTNVRLVRTDAAHFVANLVPVDSVDCFHIYFPDPWPKKRHHKRRFFCDGNLEHLIRCLKTHGSIRIATDHAEYFDVIGRLIETKKDRLERAEFLPTAGADLGQWVGTNFERKYLKEKRPIYTLALTKK
ncbi:MAG: tRNA (guanosine(46)-N7)-methyltransferase TrmB [Planctomycetota bacterium]|jgi:tRNA (guanine-N7-)-methyltransferase